MTVATLYLLRYNNYYNRQVKKKDTLSDYLEYQLGEAIEGVNFIPNDYVNTQQVVNWDAGNPNYLLVVDEDNNINSRWFIINTSRIREGQLMLDLHRDLIVDYNDSVLSANMFIDKATPISFNDPAIYNSENMTFNQIKQEEIQLKDKTGIPWIVGYIPSDSFSDNSEQARTVEVNFNFTGAQDITVENISDYTYYQYTTTQFQSKPQNKTYCALIYGTHNNYGGLPGVITSTDYYYVKSKMDTNGVVLQPEVLTTKDSYNYDFKLSSKYNNGNFKGSGSLTGEDISAVQSIWEKEPLVLNQLNSYIDDYLPIPPENIDSLLAQDGKIIYASAEDQYYKVNLVQVGNKVSTLNYVNSGGLYDLLKNNATFNQISRPISDYWPSGYFAVTADNYIYKLSITRLASSKAQVIIPQTDTRYHLNDSPYDMFCMPFPDIGQTFKVEKNGSIYLSNVDRDAAFSIGTRIAAQSGSSTIYDVQLLPYCPISSIVQDGYIDIGDRQISDINIVVGNSTNKRSVLLWCTSSQFTLDIDYNIPESTTIEDKKIKNETEVWRLCSPNYSGLFEFSPEKNAGVTSFNVDCNYKPFSPYIHINPNFNNLYGQDFNDSRGLVCGGDFSLPQVTSAWADYQLSNKNYQQMFDRGIQNMEVNNAVQREKEQWQMAAGVMQAYAQGKQAGDSTLLGLGGLLGVGNATGLAAAGFSYAAGKRDIELNDQLRYEALDYSKDMFGYQLGNIQALPQGLAKVSAFTANNKIFPFLEKYGCTDTEKMALKNKLKFNGYTIMRIGSIAEFIHPEETYIKGSLIRMPDNFQEDFHIVNSIAKELNQGVFI